MNLFAAVSPNKEVPRRPQILLQGTLGVSRDVCGCHHWGCSWHRGSGGQGCCSPPQGPAWPPRERPSPRRQQCPGGETSERGVPHVAIPTAPGEEVPALALVLFRPYMHRSPESQLRRVVFWGDCPSFDHSYTVRPESRGALALACDSVPGSSAGAGSSLPWLPSPSLGGQPRAWWRLFSFYF